MHISLRMDGKYSLVYLVNRVIPQVKKLAHNLSRLATKRVMVHCVGDELLSALDLAGSVGGQVEVHIHVIDVRGSIDWNLVLSKLCLIVESWPVTSGSQSLRNVSNLAKFGV